MSSLISRERVMYRLTLALTLAAGSSRCSPELMKSSLTPLSHSNKRPEDNSESESSVIAPLIKAEVIKVCLFLLSDSIRLIVKLSGN